MAILTVGIGAGFDYSTLSGAIAASQDGDVIQVQAGTYTNDFAEITTSVTIEGVGGMVNLVATETPLQEKGILIIGTGGDSPDVTLDNISFSGAAISDDDGGNGAGIRYQSGDLTLNNCDFFDNQDGMLAGSDAAGTITINNTQFNDNGDASGPNSGYTHNLYVNDIAQLTIDNSYFYDPIVGHDIKSRAENTTIENSRIDDPNGTGSYEIDLPNGGNAVIENNVLEKGPGAQNSNFVAFGEEGNLQVNSTLTVTGNSVLNDDGGGANFVWNDTGIAASVTGNTLYGLSADQLVSGPVATPETNTFDPQSEEPALDTDAAYLPVLPFEFACFVSGTRIMTDAGERPVEALRAGQQVIVVEAAESCADMAHVGEPDAAGSDAAGSDADESWAGRRIARPIKWIGWRDLDLATHPQPELACPVRIRRGALADGVPRRDLFLSPDHAILLDGVLIPVRLLVNGGTITQDMRMRRIRYHHVELDVHGVILAEGLPAESFLDTGNRGVFQNADASVILHPDFGAGQNRRVAGSCRPFVDDAMRVEPVWRRIAARAPLLGHSPPAAVATTDDPALHLVVVEAKDGIMVGRAIQPSGVEAGRYTFVLPGFVARATLVSRAMRPCEMRPWVEDRRRLGVMVSGLTLRRGAEVEPIPLDHPRLSRGWWAVEHDSAGPWRWTDGNAVIDLCGEGPTIVEVIVAGGVDYPIGAAAGVRPAWQRVPAGGPARFPDSVPGRAPATAGSAAA